MDSIVRMLLNENQLNEPRKAMEMIRRGGWGWYESFWKCFSAINNKLLRSFITKIYFCVGSGRFCVGNQIFLFLVFFRFFPFFVLPFFPFFRFFRFFPFFSVFFRFFFFFSFFPFFPFFCVGLAPSMVAAEMVADYCRRVGDICGSIEFLTRAHLYDMAFEIAMRHDKMAVFEKALARVRKCGMILLRWAERNSGGYKKYWFFLCKFEMDVSVTSMLVIIRVHVGLEEISGDKLTIIDYHSWMRRWHNGIRIYQTCTCSSIGKRGHIESKHENMGKSTQLNVGSQIWHSPYQRRCEVAGAIDRCALVKMEYT